MPGHDHPVLVDDDGDLEAKLLDGVGYEFDCRVVIPGVVLVRDNFLDFLFYDFSAIPFMSNPFQTRKRHPRPI